MPEAAPVEGMLEAALVEGLSEATPVEKHLETFLQVSSFNRFYQIHQNGTCNEEDVETMISLYSGNRSDKNAPIHLFAELVGIEQNKDLIAYGEEHRAQKPCMVALISYVDSESTICRIDIDLNITPNIDVVGDGGYDSSDPCDQEVDSDSDLVVDEVPNDIDDKGVNDDGNINASSVGKQMQSIVIHNNSAHMSLINPDMAHVVEFSEYPEIVSTHQLAVNSDPEELFVGQRFKSKEELAKPYSSRIETPYPNQYKIDGV
ncbi:hypothetical protein PVK06_008209 [Gossypium arboreum]|uniref:Uncharacterized protein n=1 Tax=Gossypium arboreum TaxID=29729 RepID=A0ABR0QK34_GOSAR|nr:hypothetical protein PVK06_008209 [Gossypium arboreum]